MGLVVQAPIRGWRSIGQLGLPKRRMIKIVARDGGQDRSDTRQRRPRPACPRRPKPPKPPLHPIGASGDQRGVGVEGARI